MLVKALGSFDCHRVTHYSTTKTLSNFQLRQLSERQPQVYIPVVLVPREHCGRDTFLCDDDLDEFVQWGFESFHSTEYLRKTQPGRGLRSAAPTP